jgi:hypothetical protein
MMLTGLTAGLGVIGAGEALGDAELGRHPAELQAASVDLGVVGEQALDTDAVLGVEGGGTSQEGSAALGSLAGRISE